MDNKKFTRIFIPRASFYLWVIFLLIVVIGILEWKVAIPGGVLLLFLVYYNYKSNYIRQKEITKYIENLTLNIDTATKDTLLNFPMPLAVIELDGAIIWYNSSFRKIFEGKQLLDKTIDTFIEDLNPASLFKGTTNIFTETVINGRNYNVLGSLVKLDEKSDKKSERKSDNDKYIVLLYFIDVTELVELKRIYSEEKIVVGLVVIDNYDDLMQSMPDAGRPQILAEIDKRITAWADVTKGILKKYERDKYVFIFYEKYLKAFEEKKFDILDSIKEINLGNKIPVTLSIGFGLKGSSLIENFNSAATSIDIALGRGGDQAVIKNGSNFSFYGGRTRELEKRTKVKARVIAHALR